MNIFVKHQESYSRLQLLLRTFLGWLYILIPHGVALLFVGIVSAFLSFIAWWVVLFTGRYPETWFNFQRDYIAWSTRVYASFFHLVDGYPRFGFSQYDDDPVKFDIEYPESLNRATLLLRAFFGWLYVLIPHGFLLYFRAIAAIFVSFVAWWVVLFTGRYPERMHSFVAGTLRWNLRVYAYMMFLTDEYPPFSGK